MNYPQKSIRSCLKLASRTLLKPPTSINPFIIDDNNPMSIITI